MQIYVCVCVHVYFGGVYHVRRRGAHEVACQEVLEPAEYLVWCLGWRVQNSGFWVSGFGFRVSGFGFRVPEFGFWVSGFGFRVPGLGFGVWGLGFGV